MTRKFTMQDAIQHQKRNGFGLILIDSKPHENHSQDTRLGSTQPQPAPLSPLEDEEGSQNVHLATPQRRHRVRITMYRKKLLDPDNAYGAVKELLDGLVAGQLITSDSADWLELDVKQEVSKDVHTTIEIEEI